MTQCEETSACIPRHTPSNPYNYTNVQLAERKKTLKDLAEVFSLNKIFTHFDEDLRV